LSKIRGTFSNLWVSASGSRDTRATKRLNSLVSGWSGPQDFWTYWGTAWSTVFIPADQCLGSKVQFSLISQDFSVEDDTDT